MIIDNINCPPEVVEYVQTVDLASSENSGLFSWIASNSPLKCQVDSIGAIADRLNQLSHSQVIDDFCSSAATYARFLTPHAKQKVEGAYLRFPYYPSIAMSYFNGLRYNQIDIRSHLKGKITEDWTFEQPRLNAETWHYYLYLAALDEPGAYEALENKLRSTENGNDVTNLIKSLSDVKTERTKQILLQYTQDTRRAEGPEGPELMILETVSLLLRTHFQ
jgi:hypothetical protein